MRGSFRQSRALENKKKLGLRHATMAPKTVNADGTKEEDLSLNETVRVARRSSLVDRPLSACWPNDGFARDSKSHVEASLCGRTDVAA